MYKRNPPEKQLNIVDPYLHFPKYIREALHNSWAEPFFSSVFSQIDEDRFAVLYSKNYSRPNAPVNLIIGLLILKELNGWTDEDTIAALYFDYRVQYALGISDFDRERICINTLGNFRSRLYEYAEAQGRDLLGEEISRLTDALIDISGMDTRLARQDSLMISANCKQMGRLELIYTVNRNVVKLLSDKAPASIPENCRHYLVEKDKANQIYRLKKEDVPSRTEQLLKESLELYRAVPPELEQDEAFKILVRLIEEQIGDDGTTPKGNGELAADSLQNPTEPDATYRKKGHKSGIGYVMNVVEARDPEKEMSMIVYAERQPNIVSDSELGLNALDGDLKGVETLVSDGAYYSQEMVEKAEEKEIVVSFSALNGRRAPEGKLGADQFEIDAKTGLIISCPGGAMPVSSERDAEKGLFKAKFDKARCASCPLVDSCIFKEQKKFNAVTITEKKLIADRYRSLLGTAEHQALGDFRAGVEGVPSVLRRVYGIDDLPVRGLNRSRIWDHFKTIAYNFKSFYSYYKRMRANILSLAYFLRLLSQHYQSSWAMACYC
jgi:hypothetical protein